MCVFPRGQLQTWALVMGPGLFFVARVGSGRVSHLWFGFEFGKFPIKMSNFSIFFPSGQKKSLQVGSKNIWVKGGSASYFLRVKSKLRLGQGPSLLGTISFSEQVFPKCTFPIAVFLS